MSKGSRPRPFSVNQEEYDNRWNEIVWTKREFDELTAEKRQSKTSNNDNNGDQSSCKK